MLVSAARSDPATLIEKAPPVEVLPGSWARHPVHYRTARRHADVRCADDCRHHDDRRAVHDHHNLGSFDDFDVDTDHDPPRRSLAEYLGLLGFELVEPKRIELSTFSLPWKRSAD